MAHSQWLFQLNLQLPNSHPPLCSVNESLCDEPSDAELRYAIATRHNMQRRVSVRTRAIMDFDLGAAPLNAGASVVHIMMENKGQVQTEWSVYIYMYIISATYLLFIIIHVYHFSYVHVPIV